jgi:hypothetical protein
MERRALGLYGYGSLATLSEIIRRTSVQRG